MNPPVAHVRHAPPREQAIKLLAAWQKNPRRFPERDLAEVHTDRSMIMDLVYGTVRHSKSLEWILSQLIRQTPRPLQQAALTMGLYELFFRPDPADHAVVNETVEAITRLVNKREAAFVNAVLRTAIRNREDLTRQLRRQPLSIRHSHPLEITRRWEKAYGFRVARQLAEWDNVPPDVVLRHCALNIPAAEFRDAFRKEGIELRPHAAAGAAWHIVPRGHPVPSLPGYREGWFLVMDPATELAVRLLDPRPGMSVLDACAAPGGKTTLLAEAMEKEGRLVAMDRHDDRLATLRDTLRRLRLDDWVQVLKGDAADAPKTGSGDRPPLFDAVLADVPCTNTGVFRRRPDARWNFSEMRLRKLVHTQERILDGLAPLVKPGGHLVYSTCSLEPEEDESICTRWAQRHPEFHFLKAEKSIPPRTLMDGAYAALFERREGADGGAP